MDKKEIRKTMMVKRQELDNRLDKETLIYSKALEMAQDKEVIAVFVSFNKEVDTHKLIKTLLDEGKVVCCPKIDQGTMKFFRIESFNDLSKGHFNVLEPTTHLEYQAVDFDLIFVPLLAFNEKGYRVGYGKGYYDQFLVKTKGLKVGLAFAMQKVDFNFQSTLDVACDVIITEEER